MTDRDDGDRDEELPRLAPRPANRDDDADDAQLHSLRAVWLGMPDEDPPERGLAELMAAARVKAEEMARPSLWQRIAALLRRPAVLALASIMVLLGGAVLLGGRNKAVDVEPEAVTAAQQRAQDQMVVAPTAESTGSAVAGDEATTASDESAAVPGAGELAPAAEVPVLIEQELAENTPTQIERAALERSRRPRVRESKGIAKDDDGRARDEQAARGFASPPGERAPDTTAATTSSSDFAKTSAAAAVKTSAAATAEDMPAAESEVRLGATAQPTRAPQYVAQAKTAAARGDCDAARVLMKRVAKEDAALYRKALASDSALKKCVAR